jgi:hypothetical protein
MPTISEARSSLHSVAPATRFDPRLSDGKPVKPAVPSRQPSIRCGATGLRPTFGRVSPTGAMPLCRSLDKIGPDLSHGWG